MTPASLQSKLTSRVGYTPITHCWREERRRGGGLKAWFYNCLLDTLHHFKVSSFQKWDTHELIVGGRKGGGGGED